MFVGLTTVSTSSTSPRLACDCVSPHYYSCRWLCLSSRCQNARIMFLASSFHLQDVVIACDFQWWPTESGNMMRKCSRAARVEICWIPHEQCFFGSGRAYAKLSRLACPEVFCLELLTQVVTQGFHLYQARHGETLNIQKSAYASLLTQPWNFQSLLNAPWFQVPFRESLFIQKNNSCSYSEEHLGPPV